MKSKLHETCEFRIYLKNHEIRRRGGRRTPFSPRCLDQATRRILKLTEIAAMVRRNPMKMMQTIRHAAGKKQTFHAKTQQR